jgi:hypothetical protein
MTTKPLRLSPAQWALLRRLPFSPDGNVVRRIAGPEWKPLRTLIRLGLARADEIAGWRTPAGRLAVEAEDRAMGERLRRAVDKHADELKEIE